MSVYVLAFSDAHALDEVLEGVREATVDVPGVALDSGWKQPGDPGQYVTLRARSSDELRQALHGTELDVEGMVELVRGSVKGAPLVHRAHVINDAFPIYGYAPETLLWCDRCRVAHRRDRHVR